MIIKITHTCTHKTTIENVDASVKGWIKFHSAQPCYVCKPVEAVTRLCEHTEEVARGFFSPRAIEASSMQLCTSCNESR